jgi:hypothetical protein
MDVNAIDLTGIAEDARPPLEEAAAENVKRLVPAPVTEPDWFADPGTERLLAPLEVKTVWHPMGL